MNNPESIKNVEFTKLKKIFKSLAQETYFRPEIHKLIINRLEILSFDCFKKAREDGTFVSYTLFNDLRREKNPSQCSLKEPTGSPYELLNYIVFSPTNSVDTVVWSFLLFGYYDIVLHSRFNECKLDFNDVKNVLYCSFDGKAVGPNSDKISEQILLILVKRYPELLNPKHPRHCDEDSNKLVKQGKLTDQPPLFPYKTKDLEFMVKAYQSNRDCALFVDDSIKQEFNQRITPMIAT